MEWRYVECHDKLELACEREERTAWRDRIAKYAAILSRHFQLHQSYVKWVSVRC